MIPIPTHGFAIASRRSGIFRSEIFPTCFMPYERKESPKGAKTVTPASTRYLRRFTGLQTWTVSGGGGAAVCGLPLAASLALSFTNLFRIDRTFRNVLASLYSRLRSPELNAAFRNMRKTALGRK